VSVSNGPPGPRFRTRFHTAILPLATARKHAFAAVAEENHADRKELILAVLLKIYAGTIRMLRSTA